MRDENSNFSTSEPGRWTPNDGEKIFKRLNDFLELRYQKDIELHVEEFEKKRVGVRIV